MRVVIMLPPWVRNPEGGWPWWSLLTFPTKPPPNQQLIGRSTWVLNQKLGGKPPKMESENHGNRTLLFNE